MKYLVLFFFSLFCANAIAKSDCSTEVKAAIKSINEYKIAHRELIKYSNSIAWLPKEFKESYKTSKNTIVKEANENVALLKKLNCSAPISRYDINFIIYAIKFDRLTYYHMKELNEDDTITDSQKLSVFNELQGDSIKELRQKYL